jgi:hypothetical protein
LAAHLPVPVQADLERNLQKRVLGEKSVDKILHGLFAGVEGLEIGFSGLSGGGLGKLDLGRPGAGGTDIGGI